MVSEGGFSTPEETTAYLQAVVASGERYELLKFAETAARNRGMVAMGFRDAAEARHRLIGE